MRMGIPICELFSNPHTFAYWDPHMHTAIPVWEITHMGIQDLISHMEIFPVCIWLVTEISPYAYGDYVSCDPRMHTGISAISLCIWGLILIPVCIRGSHDMQSPYAYGDSLDPCMHTGIDLDPHGDFMFWTWRVHVVHSQNSDSLHDTCKNSDSMRDSRKDR